MNNMKEEKQKTWEEVITSTNMTYNSRKAWKIIKHISNDPTSHIAPCLNSANPAGHQLLINSRGTMSNTPKRPVLLPTAEESMVYPFSDEEYRTGIATLKDNKAAGIVDVLVEQLNTVNHCSTRYEQSFRHNKHTHTNQKAATDKHSRHNH